jgi:glyoxylase-like metal-dependent hydrolase (beta-lactamase superfamily II)
MTEETAMSEMDSVEAAAPPAPVVTADPVEIADGVYVIPDGRVPLVPNVGIVLGDRAALVVDTGMGPTSGARVLEHARALAGDRPLLLTVTHFHPEHGFGAQVFEQAAVVVYNTAQRDELRQKGEAYIQMFRGFGDSVAEQLVDVRLVDPHVTYDGPSAEIQLGGRTARLMTWGRAHTGGDQVVLLPEESIVFGGDLIETRMFPIVPYVPPDDTDVDGHRWIEVLGKVIELGPGIVVPGHGEVADVGLVEVVRDYLVTMRDEAAAARRQGLTADEAVDALASTVRDRHPDWDNPEWIDFAIRCFHDQVG